MIALENSGIHGVATKSQNWNESETAAIISLSAEYPKTRPMGFWGKCFCGERRMCHERMDTKLCHRNTDPQTNSNANNSGRAQFGSSSGQ
eukprot:CAMPEP_0197233900 /NCGR_PEP_ID=MMETSP1429-20130617/1822_1 /TAXON_ID=49237 /ORGANISM="Chaetoceros  sp., Strain UNC1202" /LENGTH=89 /DNA_ID=CAMNT_0042692217 /DNA_START=599 /DNA_END=868 /DNA_ORIENTATION=+